MMRFSWAKVAMLAVVAATVLAPVTTAMAQQQASEKRVDLNLKDADLLAATKMLTDKTGLMFVFEPGNEPFRKVTLKLEGVSPEDAIRYLCQAADAHFRRDDMGVFIISRKKPEVPAVTPPTKIVRTLKKIPVLKASSRDVFDMVMYGIPVSSTRGFEELKRFKSLSESDYTRIYGTGPTVLNQSGTGFTYPVQTSNNMATPVVETERGGDVMLPGESANQFGGRQGGGGNSGFGGGGGAGGLGGGQGGGQGGGGSVQLQGGQGLVGESIDFISYDPTDNSLVVRGSEEDINQLQQYISLFDVAPKQVLVKVEFITTTDTLDRALGFDFTYQRGAVFAGNRPGSFARSGDPIFLNYATGNITTRMRAVLNEGQARVVTAPILRTLNNQPAIVNSSIQTWVFLQNQTISNGTVVTTTTPISFPSVTSLGIAPRINDDNTITMFLQPQVSTIVGTSRGPDGSEVPNQSQQSISVVARVRNGDTIVLGGLNSKNDDIAVSRIPVLSELPILGQFFRGTRRAKSNSELLIFVTPTVIEDEEDTIGGL